MSVYYFDADLNQLDFDVEFDKLRSFNYGDGHFTTIKVIEGEPKLKELHINRLQQANQKLGFADIQWHKLSDFIQQLASSTAQAVIKVHVNRGLSSRGYGGTMQCKPLITVTCSETVFEALKPLEIKTLDTKLGLNPMLAGMKHCNRLEQVMISREIEQKQLSDGLVADLNGHLIETNKANVFWFENGKWYTADVSQSGVAGVMREAILLRQAIPVVTRKMVDVVNSAQAMVVCNSIIGIVPIAKVNTRALQLNHAKDFIERFNDIL